MPAVSHFSSKVPPVPTITDAGYSLAAGGGFTPTSHLAFVFNLAQTRLSSRLRTDGRGGVAGFRGGTLTLAAAELRVSLFRRDRVGPYGLAGFAAGMSRPKHEISVIAGACPMMYGPGVDVGHACMRWILRFTDGLPT